MRIANQYLGGFLSGNRPVRGNRGANKILRITGQFGFSGPVRNLSRKLGPSIGSSRYCPTLLSYTCTFLILVALFFGAISSCSKESDQEIVKGNLEKLKNTNVCSQCDLREANLVNEDLTGADLSNTDLSVAVLTGPICLESLES